MRWTQPSVISTSRLLLHMLLLLWALALSGCMDKQRHALPRQSTDSRLLDLAQHDTRGGFARAHEGRTFRFPEDHAGHPRFKQERWRFSGNLQTSDGQEFAYQFTIQRLGLINEVVSMLNQQGATAKQSRWRSNHLYLANFSVTDIANKKFYQFEKSERSSLGLADVKLEQEKPGAPHRLTLKVDNWTVTSSVTGIFPLHISLAQNGVSVDIEVNPARDSLANGADGLLQEGEESGNANYSYSITRLTSSGRINLGDQRATVKGLSWFDHQWGTAPLGHEIAGVDHYTVQLSNGLDLSYYRLRDKQQNGTGWSRGSLVFSNGKSEEIRRDDIELEVTRDWTSPQTGVSYPLSWNLKLPKYHIALYVTPLMSDQEIRQGQTWWEGAIKVAGYQDSSTAKTQTITGRGYLELKGYR